MTGPDDDDKRRYPRLVLAAELVSVALCGWYVYTVLYPDATERGMRSWSWASAACYHGAARLGRAGMACERRYMSLTGA